jgi:hypothetical protein
VSDAKITIRLQQPDGDVLTVRRNNVSDSQWAKIMAALVPERKPASVVSVLPNVKRFRESVGK